MRTERIVMSRWLLVCDQADHVVVGSSVGLTQMTKDLFRFLEAKLPAE